MGEALETKASHGHELPLTMIEARNRLVMDTPFPGHRGGESRLQSQLQKGALLCKHVLHGQQRAVPLLLWKAARKRKWALTGRDEGGVGNLAALQWLLGLVSPHQFYYLVGNVINSECYLPK